MLLAESLIALEVHPGGRYVDCTLGTGGHAEAILEKAQPGGNLLGIDADSTALAIAAKRLERFGGAASLVNGNFDRLREIARAAGWQSADGILFDLGLSSLELERRERGFSFQIEGPLDMRFDPYRQRLTAELIVNDWTESQIAEVLFRYGEERRSRQIARAIVGRRPIRSTTDLARIVEQAVGGRRGRTHPATRTFQALRIAVNRELEALETALPQARDLLVPGGRLVVIGYHSLEDRIVKNFLRLESGGCICPPHLPVCVCGQTARLRPIGKGATVPSAAEVAANPSSRSAKLRAAERL